MKTRIRQGLVYGFIIVLFTSVIFQQASKVKAAEPPLELKAPSAILVDADTGKVLYAKKAEVPRSPASMTKMMAEYLILDAIEEGTISWDSKVHINDYIYNLSQNYNLSGVPLRKDVTYTVKELYEAMVIYSANAATVALGRRIYGGEQEFVEAMNKKAKELGLKNTKFVNSTGLNNSDLYGHIVKGGPNDENVMSAKATAKLAYHLLKDHKETVLKYSQIPVAKFTKGVDEPIVMRNWNKMVIPESPFYYQGVKGLKTGHTDKAGWCFTAYAERGDMHLISVVMKTDSEAARFNQTEILLNYGFGHFEKETLLEKGYVPKGKGQLPVAKGTKDSVAIATKDPIKMVIKKGTKDQYKPTLTLSVKNGKITAPVKKGQKVGTVVMKNKGKGSSYGYLTDNGAEQAAATVVTTEKVEKASWFTLALRGIGDFFSDIWTGIADTIKGWF